MCFIMYLNILRKVGKTMENASKALLIAAAVLVVIILVAVGMKIYSSTSGTQKRNSGKHSNRQRMGNSERLLQSIRRHG